MTDDVRKLLGGYATGTLSSEEREQLFEAALHDDKLFAALSDEQALKDLLDDSAVRAQVLRATEEPRFSVLAAFREWFESPKSKALVATGVVVLALIGLKELGPMFTPQREIAEMHRPSLAIRGPAEAPANPATVAPAPTPSAVRAKPPRERQQQPPREQPTISALKKEEQDQFSASTLPIPSQQLADQVAQTTPPAPAPAPPERQAVTVEPGVVAGYRAGPEIGASSRQLRLSGGLRSTPASVSSTLPSLRYELLRREPGGEFRAVPNQYEFAPGDVVRVRVTSLAAGGVAVSVQDQQTMAAQIKANEAAAVPSNGGITITANTSKLVLAFAPSGAVSNSLSERVESKAKQAAPASLTIEIPIRVRRP